jgi:hypothetical protein
MHPLVPLDALPKRSENPVTPDEWWCREAIDRLLSFWQSFRLVFLFELGKRRLGVFREAI